MPRPAELVPVSPCSCPPSGLQLFHSQVNCTSKIVLAKCDFWLSLRSHFTSQERAFKCIVDFHSQVTHLWRTCLQVNRWLSLASHPTALHPIREGLPLWHGFLLWRSHPACELDTAISATHPVVQDAHWGLGFALWRSICSDTATRPIGQGHTLLFPILFVAEVPAQLS